MGTDNFARISRLRALIDHANTGAGERATAQRMLDRLLRKTGGGNASRPSDRVYGERHHRPGRHATTAAIVESVREDISFARTFAPGAPGEVIVHSPLAAAPAELTVAVTTPFADQIVVTIDDIPPQWGWESDEFDRIVATRDLRALADELAEIIDAYNHYGPDVGPRFFRTIRAQQTTLIR
ncbi:MULTISPECIES: hypothetical protein [Nocardia]|uniref:Uncharacterized protein n=2 Tax=Nocardia TaxID=1817 RepID=A0A4V3CQ18_NOCIG|nr:MULTISPECIES: hypothetical protein [Nocardia]NKX90736.1 hypothetical protein [Nocardia coubleae]TDP40035.1 hypothetical protein DFR75_102757 [Nocardia ignorata]